MALTFRSSVPETQLLAQHDPDGRSRYAVATRNLGSTRHWDLRVQHPSGQSWNGTFNGEKNEVPLALADMLSRTENEFKSDKARHDRPASQPYDHNRRVVDAASPIIPVTRR
jgi:hypothetical protein